MGARQISGPLVALSSRCSKGDRHGTHQPTRAAPIYTTQCTRSSRQVHPRPSMLLWIQRYAMYCCAVSHAMYQSGPVHGNSSAKSTCCLGDTSCDDAGASACRAK